MGSLLLLMLPLFGCESEPEPTDSATDTAPSLPPPPGVIEVTPAALSFPELVVGCDGSVPQAVTISSTGEDALRVQRVSLEGDAAASYSMPEGDTWTSVLQPGETEDIYVVFKPNLEGVLEARLDIASNDADQPVVSVPLTGTGDGNASTVETFTQTDLGAADVLWVIDNSLSMAGVPEELGNSIDALTSQLDAWSIDYQLGIVTTDMDDPDQSGRLQGSGVFSASHQGSTQGAIDAFAAAAAALGSDGSPDERGRDAAYAALTEPLLSGANAGFLREDATLAIIVVSDELDTSANITQPDFVDWLDALKADPSHTSVSSVTYENEIPFGFDSLPEHCDSGQPPVGMKYEPLVQETGGVSVQLCDMDYWSTHIALSRPAAGLKDSFPLASPPPNAPSGLQITVEGQPVQYSPINGFSYDQTSNAIVFSHVALPAAGDTIEVAYQTTGACD